MKFAKKVDAVNTDLTRREYREIAGIPHPSVDVVYDVNSLYPEPYEPLDLPDRASWAARSRKALTAAVAGFAAGAGPLIQQSLAAGVWVPYELVSAALVGLGCAIAAGLAVWYMPNAEG